MKYFATKNKIHVKLVIKSWQNFLENLLFCECFSGLKELFHNVMNICCVL